jgi:hypothetical protein
MNCLCMDKRIGFEQGVLAKGEGSVVSTVDLLVLTSSDQLLFILKMYFLSNKLS